MNTRLWQTDSMLAGLTRGLWTGTRIAGTRTHASDAAVMRSIETLIRSGSCTGRFPSSATLFDLERILPGAGLTR